MNLLGLDTATAVAVACVLRSDGKAFEAPADPARLFERPQHSAELLPAAARALERAGLDWADLDAVAVGVGPGSFTGLRVGIATARALASAHGLELRPVPSLAALATGMDAPLALPLVDARRGEVFAALYDRAELRWPAFAAAPDAVAARVAESGLTPQAAGDGSVRFRSVLEAAGIRVAPADDRVHLVRGLHVCRLGREAAPHAPDSVLPDYLRDPDAKPQPTA